MKDTVKTNCRHSCADARDFTGYPFQGLANSCADARDFTGYDYLGKSCSAQDCTGLIPASPSDPEELEAYEELYPYLPPQKIND